MNGIEFVYPRRGSRSFLSMFVSTFLSILRGSLRAYRICS